MCGIAGVFEYGAPGHDADRALVERMTRALAHRGPDGEGFHLDGAVGLGHRRLSIVDLSPTGAQPMATEDGRCWITYNGEFYDHLRHRPALAARHRFRGRSDTETLLNLVADRGVECLEELSAIFAFAFWDGRTRTLLLACDPLGVKQVYWYDDGRRLVFASEIKALFADADVPRALDVEALNEYLHFRVPLFGRTFFRGIQKLQGGEVLEVREGGRPAVRRYFAVSDFSPDPRSDREQVGALRALLADVVRDQLMSDVPVGAFFSGGVDSSAVAAFAIRAGRTPRCFGVHFSDQGVIDERPYQEAAARSLGVELELTTLDGRDFPDALERLLFAQDEPLVGSALLPMHAVARLAARSVKVCLGGQAADELFGGYARYGLAHPVAVARTMIARRARAWLGGRAPAGAGAAAAVGGNLARQLADPRTLRRLARNVTSVADPRELYFQNFANVPEPTWREVFAEGIVRRDRCREVYRDAVDRSPATDVAAKLMHWDQQAYLPGLFQQDDRMSMSASLESRVPLADPRVARFAARVPFRLKMKDGASKWILRAAVSDVLPAEVLTRRKVGFDTPVERWMRDVHAGFVRETLLSRAARERGIWRPAGVERWLGRTGHELWPDVTWRMLCVEVWARRFLDRSPLS
jgi:asparagine synthase (glutamine-hydrolysing)